MSVNKLSIIGGVIQNKDIDGIPVHIQIVKPSGARNVRSLIKMRECIGITNHNTGNDSLTANDAMHAVWLQNVENADKDYVSVHLWVDDDSITQTIPLDEVAYHAGDGSGDGNYKTISIEICQNRNIHQAEENAKKLNAALLMTWPHLKIYKHQDWSGKYCPRVILSAGRWDRFVSDIKKYAKEANDVPRPYKNYIEIIKDKLSEPDEWIRDIDIMTAAAKASGDLGAYERLKYLPTLIEKIYND